MTLQQQLKEAKQKVIDIENEINKPRMEFDFVEWCKQQSEKWLDYQGLIEPYGSSFSYTKEAFELRNHHLAEKIITWQIEKYIEKYDKGWRPDWSDEDQRKLCLYFNGPKDTIVMGDGWVRQILPNTFYFSKKVSEKIKHLPEILKREYGVGIFNYWLTGER